MKYGSYEKVGNSKQIEMITEETNRIFEKVNELKKLSSNKLNKLIEKIKQEETKAVVYLIDEEYTENKGKENRIKSIRRFCEKNKINVIEEYIDYTLVNNYTKKQLNKLIVDAISKKFNTIIVANAKDIGENTLINTYIINEVFIKNNIRFIDIEQKVDTNFDETLVAYENPIYRSLMNFINAEEKE